VEKLVMVKHSTDLVIIYTLLNNTSILVRKCKYRNILIREAIEIEFHATISSGLSPTPCRKRRKVSFQGQGSYFL
jgi:hypothetical protein